MKWPMLRWLILAALLAVILPLSAFLLATKAPGQTSTPDDKQVLALLAGQLRAAGIKPDKLDVSTNTAGARIATLQLSVSDAQYAGPFIDQTVSKLKRLIPLLNAEQGTHISAYKVNLVDAAQRLLFRYENDLEQSSENWWQAADVHPSGDPAGPSPTQRPTEAGLPVPASTPTSASYPPAASTTAFLPVISSP